MLTGFLSKLVLVMAFASTFALAQGPSVVVTIPPYASLLEELLDGRGEVNVLLPAGASPHTFEPTPRQAVALSRADLVVMNGGVDEWVHGLVEASGANVSYVEALDVLEPHLGEIAGEEVHGSDSHDHHGAYNPHVWLDPLLMIPVVERIAQELAKSDPQQGSEYLDRARQIGSDLMALDDELRTLLKPVQGAPFVPFHDAWPYFAARYGLDLVVELEPFPGREPSPAYLANALKLIQASQAPAIFSEVGLPQRPAQVIAQEANVEVFELDPLGTGSESYRELLIRNAAVILDALKEADE